MRSTILNYKWAGPLTKLYPVTNGRTGQREHHTTRHTPRLTNFAGMKNALDRCQHATVLRPVFNVFRSGLHHDF